MNTHRKRHPRRGAGPVVLALAGQHFYIIKYRPKNYQSSRLKERLPTPVPPTIFSNRFFQPSGFVLDGPGILLKRVFTVD